MASLTIKKVLDRFSIVMSDNPFLFCGKTTDLISEIYYRKRTTNGLCPLQEVTNSLYDYVNIAIKNGLSSNEISAIMTWADTGKWPIKIFIWLS